MSTHSKIGASSMSRWSKCAGSVRMSEGLSSPSSSYADEGTKAHEIAALILTNKPDDVDCDSEMFEAISVYTEFIQKESHGNEVLIEQKFDLSAIFHGLYGTADAVIYDSISKTLKVVDFKYGRGILIEPENNMQLMYYGLGALLHTAYPASFIELVIVQPRANHVDGPIRRWRISVAELILFATRLRTFAEATESPDAPLVSGDHCRFCPAAGICPEFSKKALAIAVSEFSPTLKYDPLVLGETLRKLDLLDDYSKRVREFAYSEAMNGNCPPGWKLVNKRAVRKWRDPEDMARRFMHEEIFDKTLKSPAQLEKFLGKNASAKDVKNKIAELTVLISSGLTLVAESDSRQPALVSAADEFEIINE